jgi:hypothetical protein
MLSRRLRLKFRRLPVSATLRSKLALLAFESRRLSGSIGDCDGSLCDMLYEIVGEPNDEDRDGGGTDGYDKPREGTPYVTGGFEFSEADEGGVVKVVLLLTKLAGLVDVTGENGKGDSDEEGECDKGVVRSDILFSRGS